MSINDPNSDEIPNMEDLKAIMLNNNFYSNLAFHVTKYDCTGNNRFKSYITRKN